MDETRAQPPIPSGQQTYPPAYPPPPPPYPYYDAPQTTPRRSGAGTLGRALRLILRRTLYGLALLGRALRPFWLPLLIFLVMGGVIAWMALQLWGPKPSGQQVPDTRVPAMAPAVAIEDYIRGQQTYNADLMWSSYSSRYQASQLEQGASKETLQVQADTEKTRGLKYVNYDYIGAVSLDGGGGMYFYSVDLELQGQRGTLPMIFTVDSDGKVIRVNWPPSSN